MRLNSTDSFEQPQQVLVYPTQQQPVPSPVAGSAQTPPSPGTPVLQPAPQPPGGNPPIGAPHTYLLGVPSPNQFANLLPGPMHHQTPQQLTPPQGSPQQQQQSTTQIPQAAQMVLVPSGASSTSGENTPRQQSLNDSLRAGNPPPSQVLVAVPGGHQGVPTAPTAEGQQHPFVPMNQSEQAIVPIGPQSFIAQQQPQQQFHQPPPHPQLQATKLMAPPAFAQQATHSSNKPPATQLIVNFISSSVSEKDLKRLFEKYGEVENVKILYDKATAKTKGFGFVYFTEYQAAVEAMKGLQGYELKGKCIKVGWANQRQPRASVTAPVPVPVPVPLAGGQIAHMMPPPTLFGGEGTPSMNNVRPHHASNLPQVSQSMMMVPQSNSSIQQYPGQPPFLGFPSQ